MAIKATPLSGWQSYTPPMRGNDPDAPDAVRCEVRPLLPELEANVGMRQQIDVDLQRRIFTTCCRGVENYTGTHGNLCETPLDVIRYGGREGARFMAAVVNHIVGLSMSEDDMGESDAPSASS